MALKFMTTKNPIKTQTSTALVQKFKYLLVLDFEATCEKDVPINHSEIIEFPCVALNTREWRVENVFHKYVKPRVNPILSPFCTELTGIMQETVDDEAHFPQVFTEFCRWLEANNYIANGNESAFVTCGDWDLKVMLPGQCALDQVSIPNYFKHWINLKNVFCQAKHHYPRSLKDMLIRLELTPEGRLHSGLCDVYNMTRIIQHLGIKHHVNFDLTTSLTTQNKS